MRRLAKTLLIGLGLSLVVWGAACAAGANAGSNYRAPGQAAPATGQQVLVLLRLPAEHFRPNSDYADSYGDGAGLSARRRIASRIAHEHGLTLDTSWPMPLLGVDCFVMTVPQGQSPAEVAVLLAHDPGVEWSEPMHVYRAQGKPAPTHNDPLFATQPAAREWRLADLHEIATGRDVRVAVIDSKVEVGHPDLQGQIQTSQDFVLDHPGAAEQHGTGVAGVIAGVADNRLGIAGVAPRARLMALRACWQQAGALSTLCDTLSLAKALHFAIDHRAQIINLSLSGPPDPLLGRLLDVALVRGITVVGAFDPDLEGGGFPASHTGVVAVSDDPAAPAGIYLAPGRGVPTTQPGGRWYLVNGSSYSAAHVSGLFALMRERSPLAQGAVSLVSQRPGGGAIDTCATLMRAAGPCACACARPPEVSAIVRQ
jgi:hypothetical protein